MFSIGHTELVIINFMHDVKFACVYEPSAVIERTRDVKDVIRREAFLWIANKCSIRHLTIEERIQVSPH